MSGRKRRDNSGGAALSALPSVTSLLAMPETQAIVALHGRGVVVAALRQALSALRGERETAGLERDVLAANAVQMAAQIVTAPRGTLVPVVNATGVVLHTNLGRAPLAREAVEAVARAASGYCAIEYDLTRGERGERHGHAAAPLRALFGCEDAVVVNNNAAATLLALTALCQGREIIVSRGELVEIGGGFRIPDVLRQSGARLIEVGTTNKTRLRDYADAIGEHTAALLKVNQSAFAQVGFTAEATLAELSTLAGRHHIPLIYDAGSGCVEPGPSGAMPVAEALRQGADLVLFSGDKLLGGPQAGLAVGKASLVEQLRRHPLMRAVRPDKLCLAALVETLHLWRHDPQRVPSHRMLTAPVDQLEARALAIAAAVGGEGVSVRRCVARVGGGTSPLASIESAAVEIRAPSPEQVEAKLRQASPPVIGRISEGALLLDLRTVDPSHDKHLATALRSALDALTTT